MRVTQLPPYTQPLPGIPDLSGSVTKHPDYSIAFGAFSDLYSGYWCVPGVQPLLVAIKVLRGVHQDPEDYERVTIHLNRESAVWRKLDHPNVLRFYGIDYTISASPALISPLCQQGDISSYFKNNPNASRFLMLSGVAEGLDYLHSKNIVHGDIKQQNILVSDQYVPLLCDFGRAKILYHRGFTTKLAGTFKYMAPELLASDDEFPDLTTESDVYAFAIVGAEIVTGVQAFPGPVAKIPQKVLNGERPQPVGLRGRSVHAWHILVDCWAHETTIRWPMNAVVKSLHQIRT